MSHLEIKNLYKIFGHNSDKALEMSNNGVEKSEILKETGATIGVNNVSFNIEKGETFVVMGLSGSGKSTLIRCLNRLITPTSGQVIVDGEDVIAADPEKLRMLRRKKMAMVFQNFGLFPHRTIRRNVDYGLEVQGVEEEERIERAYKTLETVGLKGYEEQRPNELSGGMQQRVGLARALVNDPDILLMDEAFSALDPLIRNDMQDQLIELQEKMHKTIVFITHDLDEALKLGDRIAVMYDGTIVQIGTPEEILTNPANDYVKNFVENVDRSKVIKAESIMRKPRAVIDSKDGPKMALRQMDKEQISSIFVTDKNHKLKGVVDAEEAQKLVEKGEKNLKSIIKTEEIYEVSPDTLISDLLPMASKSKYPIAVVDEDRKLKGIIVRVSVIAGIHGKNLKGDEKDA
ncbi:MAG: quaternary amine ABC transporter ATP-binding protein [Bacillota bacterium]